MASMYIFGLACSLSELLGSTTDGKPKQELVRPSRNARFHFLLSRLGVHCIGSQILPPFLMNFSGVLSPVRPPAAKLHLNLRSHDARSPRRKLSTMQMIPFPYTGDVNSLLNELEHSDVLAWALVGASTTLAIATMWAGRSMPG